MTTGGGVGVQARDREETPVARLGHGARQAMMKHVAGCGFAPFEAAIRPGWLAEMQAEAQARFADSVVAEQTEGLSYRANITSLGPVARAFLQHRDVMSLLSTYFGGAYSLSEDISCLTFYNPAGLLEAHLDEPAEKCAVTIIIYLLAASPDPEAKDTGLVLNIYGEDKASIGTPRLRIPTRTGSVVLGRGARVWHERPRLKPGESVVAITGCYRYVG